MFSGTVLEFIKHFIYSCTIVSYQVLRSSVLRGRSIQYTAVVYTLVGYWWWWQWYTIQYSFSAQTLVGPQEGHLACKKSAAPEIPKSSLEDLLGDTAKPGKSAGKTGQLNKVQNLKNKTKSYGQNLLMYCTFLHILVIISDALQRECYHSNMTTKRWIYHHKNVGWIPIWTLL